MNGYSASPLSSRGGNPKPAEMVSESVLNEIRPPYRAWMEVYVKEHRGDDAVVFPGGNEYPMQIPLTSLRPIEEVK